MSTADKANNNEQATLPSPEVSLFRVFVENFPVIFFAVEPDPPHVPLYISPSFAKFGYPLEDWRNDPFLWDRIIHEEDRERVLAASRKAIKERGSMDLEYRIRCRNGSIMWVRDKSCMVSNADGTPLCWQGVILDITERKKAEHELAKREKLYRTLARSIPKTAVLLFDKDHRYTIAEGEQLAAHNWSTEMFENRTLKDLFSSPILEEWSDYYDRALAGEDIAFESESEGKFYQINVRPVRDENGEIFAGMVMWKDISEKRKAEIAIAESEARFRELFENANDIIYVHDLQGNYISINSAGERIFGYTREEALKLNMADVVAPEHIEKVRKHLSDKIEGRKTQTTYEVECIKKDGSRAVLEINSSVIQNNGLPVAVQGIARDITDRRLAEEAIRKSEERYRDLFENANDMIYTHDLEGNFTSLNRAGELISGYSREEALQMNIAQVVAPEYLAFARTMTARKLGRSGPTTYEVEIIAKSGKRVTLELSTRLILSADGLPVGVQGIGRDITDRRQTEIDLHKTISLFASTFESTADGIVVMSLDKEIVTCNRKFCEMWDVPNDIIEKKDGPRLIELVLSKARDPDKFRRDLERVYADPYSTACDVVELTDGRVFERYSQPQMLEGRPVGRVACFRDITERKRAEEKIRYHAVHDTLTDLPNRVEFMNQLRDAINRTEGNEYARFAVLFLDLDRFKVINDSLGHAVGDKLLIAIAERLKACVRPGDVVARLGGDEFTILLNRSGDPEDIARVAERLQSRISEPFKIDNYEVFTTASIGIVVSDGMKRAPEDFLRDADAAMYRAKEAGKARYEIFDQEMHVRNMNLLQIENDLRRAVERHEFEVLYQPIVELDTGLISEFEALIRWRHPVHGLVTPNEFIHVAEETGLIVQIGRWILEESCRQIEQWQRRFDMPFAVSVNLSAKQLMHPNLTNEIRQILDETGISASQLKLEVTESTVMEHSEKSLKILQQLDQLGVSLSTDDFGTGYSSLSYLQKFPFERLKIDRSFIHLMDDDEKSGAIVKTILMLGENLGIEVVAEGIETTSQLHKLRSLGCRAGQGYLFSRPVDREAAEDILVAGANIFANNPSLAHLRGEPVIELSKVQ